MHPPAPENQRCPEVEELLMFLDGNLDEVRTPPVERHLDACEVCSELVAGMVRAESEGSTAGGVDRNVGVPAPGLPAEGAMLGRFRLLEKLGEGGMGVVFAAHDAALDRKVAVKILRPLLLESGQQAFARLKLEAQATAKLSDPHVVTVFEVSESEGRVFIVMEYVAGGTLAAWQQRPRSWREIVSMFIKVGRGLSAVHDAGLLHRDFKPQNVLVGSDGRPRVTDFGLAHALTAVSTQPEGVVGTPAYMAPEVAAGRPVDERADQFSFCVALFEALHARRPSDGAARRGVQRQVPSWLRSVVQRGLNAEPPARHPSMHALVAALVRGTRGRQRRLIAAGAATAVFAVSGLSVHAWRASPGQQCAGNEARLVGVWDAARKAEVQRAFAEAGEPSAAGAWAKVQQKLDVYSGRWLQLDAEKCRAQLAAGAGARSLQLATERRCLDGKLQFVRAATTVFSTADAQVVRGAPLLMEMLEPLEGCEGPATARALPPAPDEASRSEVESLRSLRARAAVLRFAGKFKESERLSREILESPAARTFKPLFAEASFELGATYADDGRWKEAEATLDDAVRAAQASGHDFILHAAMMKKVFVLARTGEIKRARELIRDLAAFGERLYESDLMRLGRLNLEANLAYRSGELPEALRILEEALALSDKTFGPGNQQTARMTGNLGQLYLELGRFKDAERTFRAAVAARRKTMEPGHPLVAEAITFLGDVLLELGRPDEALQQAQEAVAVVERANGPDSRKLMEPLFLLARVRHLRGEATQAQEALGRLLPIAERALGAADPYFGTLLGQQGLVLSRLGQHDEARSSIERALALLESAARPAAESAVLRNQLGQVLMAQGRHREALGAFVGALDVQAKSGQRSSSNVRAASLLGQGSALLALGKHREAAEVLQSALDLLDASEAGAFERAEAKSLLVRALLATHPEPTERILALAAMARAELEAWGPGTTRERNALEAALSGR